MSISQLFPEEGPTLNLNFAGARTLDPRITFSRTTTGTYVGSDGFIKVAPADAPRFDHRYNPTTGEIESLGLLIEQQRTNNYHIWNSTTDTSTTINSSYIDTQTVSSVLTPRGVAATAYTATKTGNTGQYHGLGGGATSFSISSNTSISASAYIKDFNNSDYRLYFVISAYNASTGNRRYILYRARPSTGEWITGTVHSNWSTPVINVKDVGNGWYRFEISSTNTYEAGWDRIDFSFQLLNELNQQSYDPPTANTHGLYLSSPQFEDGGFPTSYIPTNGSTATRNPDNVRMEGENFSDWYNQSEGTVFVEASYKNTSGSPIYLRIQISGDATTRTDYYIQANNTRAVTFFGINNVTQASIGASVGSWPIDSIKKVATSYANDNFNQAFQGQLSNSDTSGNVPQGQNLAIIGLNFNGTIRVLIYYPTRLPNAQLISLTR